MDRICLVRRVTVRVDKAAWESASAMLTDYGVTFSGFVTAVVDMLTTGPDEHLELVGADKKDELGPETVAKVLDGLRDELVRRARLVDASRRSR